MSSVITQVRQHLIEPTAKFWTDAELMDLVNKGIKDLWRDITDLHQEHFFTVDATNVSMAASTSTLTGVPTDVHRVYLIEPADLTSTGANRNLEFRPREYHHPEFQAARAQDAISSGSGVVYYAVTGAGGPVGSPVIYVAPQVTAAVSLSFVYIPVIGELTSVDDNPIPGESDNALIAWVVAYARAKEREDRSPDPEWLQIYATEKAHILSRLTPRQEQEPDVVDDFFGSW